MTSTKAALIFTLFVAASAIAASSQTQVFVPGTTNGAFGNPINPITEYQPFVPALTVSGPGTITVTYVSGSVNWGPGIVGPNGGPWNEGTLQLPLQEAVGIQSGEIKNGGALIGCFVPQSRVDHAGFIAIDGTKGLTRAGISPRLLFFIGEGKTFEVKEAGTLFLGINDQGISDNSGGFNVEVTVQ